MPFIVILYLLSLEIHYFQNLKKKKKRICLKLFTGRGASESTAVIGCGARLCAFACDPFPHQEQDGGGALVVQWKHGGAGKRIYASNFDKKTPGQEDLSKVACCLCFNAEFKLEDLVKPVVEREQVWDATEQGSQFMV